MSLPLAGIRVVDWTLFVVGPYGAELLAQLGADVIHVEQPPAGDPQQYMGPALKGLSSLYIYSNLGKRSVHLDMNLAEDRDRMWRLIDSADVMLSNWRTGVAEKFGFSQAAVLARNPDIVHLPANGWGEFGPMRDVGGTDPTVQAFCGWCSITGEEGGPWQAQRYMSTIDANSGLYIAAATLTALFARKRVHGQGVNLSMLEAAVSMQANRLSEYLAGGVTPGPLGSAYSVIAPSQAFRCLDQAYLAVAAETEGQWGRLCAAVDRPELAADPRFLLNRDRVEHRRELAAALGAVFASKPAWFWSSALNRARVPNSKFLNWDLIRHHPQMLENEHLVKVDTGKSGVITTPGPVWKFTTEPVVLHRNPYTGEHTDEVLNELSRRPPTRRRVRPDGAVPELPFTGLRVVDLSSGLTGPYCTMLLADQGAQVVKLEVGAGDPARGWGPPFVEGVGTAYRELNRHKSIRLLGDGELGKIQELVAEADVVVADAFDGDGAPPTIRLEDARARDPRLIWCSISHYGESGPLAGLPGSELTVQAMVDVAGGLGRIGEPPLRIGADQAAMSAGVFAYQGILAALLRREREGTGDAIAVSSLGAITSIKGNNFTGMSDPDVWPALHLTLWTDPPSLGYRTADLPVQFTVSRKLRKGVERAEIEALIRSLGGVMPAEMDLTARPGDVSAGPGDLRWKPFWEDLFSRFGWRDLERIFAEHGGEIFPTLDYPELDRHPQVKALGLFVEGDGGRFVRVPWRMSVYPDGFTQAKTETTITST